MSFWKDRRVVVAGGGGFVGSHIRKLLADYPCQVFVPRTRDGCDFTDLRKTLEYFNKTKPDIVFNCCAYQGGIRYQQLYPGKIYYANLLMGTFLMEAARLTGVKKYINISAGCGYPGYLKDEVMDESVYWNGPLHESVLNYGFTKKAQIVQGWCYKKQYAFNSIHLIMANMYGPGEHFHPDRSHGLAALIKKIYDARRDNTGKVEIWGTGKPVREWLYVKDAAVGIVRAAEVYDEVAPINISTGHGYTIAALASIIKNIMGYEGELFYNTAMPDGAMKKVLGVGRMKQKLNWEPGTSIETGIRETIQWLEKNYAAAAAG